MAGFSGKDAAGFAALRDVLEGLLAPNGCPWDREQTPDSLCEYLAEETFELIEAIRGGSIADVREEMGDVLFLLLHISRLYAENFSLGDVFEENAAKMVRRHPHVFAGKDCENREALLKTWEEVKKREKAGKRQAAAEEGESGTPEGVFASLPHSLPPMLKSYRIHSKAARADFTWDSDTDVEMQVEAEWLEWLDACQSGDAAREEHELGDLLFTLVELGRRKGIKANAALDKTALRFLRRFAMMEKAAAASGRDFASLDMDEKNALWEEAKAEEKKTAAS